MILTDLSGVPEADLPVEALRAQLRLGTGFADDGIQDPVLLACLRAALTRLETRLGKAVLRRRFRWRVEAWRDLARFDLPLAPAVSVESFVIHDRGGTVRSIAPDRYRLVPDTHRPAVVATGFALPTIPVGGAAEVVFDAGYGAAWDAVPGDLAQAVLMLAADLYDGRGGAGGDAALPAGVAELTSAYRPLRLFGGRA
ncbi:hypothetical protein EKE94_08965 [Mesobaculum littorinae]|uniref:Phage gp6-like head-tail connector protein n=1 Tax=Mesobaculum littorinae TaxID=2486419 RepID=A0A438AJX9_9RHOB|nr:hypothetical protein [Mesobaculum littorinae]RVV98998.1 hypothetical protein EKE94_08965 [Mesobaculum littorinae]